MAEFQTTESTEKVIDKYDLMESIGLLFDELAEAKRELALARAVKPDTTANPDALSETDIACLKAGRRFVFEDSTNRYWNCVNATRDEDGTVILTPFEQFRRKIVNRVPDDMSKAEFYRYFDPQLRELYKRQCEQATEELKEADHE